MNIVSITPKHMLFCLVVVMVSGCTATGKNVEMPYDPEDQDALRPSPCACIEYTEYNNQFLSMDG